MNTTSRAILQTVLGSDCSLSQEERSAIQRIIDGKMEITAPTAAPSAHLLITQKKAAELLSVSRVTVWRMTKDCVLHPVEILPGTWRYPYQEIADLVRGAVQA